jgi:hypothetical protein
MQEDAVELLQKKELGARGRECRDGGRKAPAPFSPATIAVQV